MSASTNYSFVRSLRPGPGASNFVTDVARHGATSANAVGKMPDVLPASGLMIGFAVLFKSVDPAAGFTPCSSLPLQRAPGPVRCTLLPLMPPPGRLVSFHVAGSSPSHCPLPLGSITHEPPV